MLPQRKSLRLDKKCYETKGTLFHIIIRTADSRTLFDISPISDDIYSGILTGPVAKESDLNSVCLMPDHIHLPLGVLETNLINLMDRWKSFTTNRLHRFGISGDIWQRSFFDHAMRSDEDLVKVAQYIIENPVRAGIVNEASEYPYSWHKWM